MRSSAPRTRVRTRASAQGRKIAWTIFYPVRKINARCYLAFTCQLSGVLRGNVVVTPLGVPSDGTCLKTEVYVVGASARIRNITVLIDTRVLRHRGHCS